MVMGWRRLRKCWNATENRVHIVPRRGVKVRDCRHVLRVLELLQAGILLASCYVASLEDLRRGSVTMTEFAERRKLSQRTGLDASHLSDGNWGGLLFRKGNAVAVAGCFCSFNVRI
jgi:hypothetical protein